MVDLLLRHGQVLTLDPQRRILADGAIAIAGGRIVAVGPDADVSAAAGGAAPPASVRDLGGALVHPGLVDGHNHTNSRAFRGFFPKGGADWSVVELATLDAMTPELERVSAQLSAMEMVASGTTTYADTGGSIHLEETVAGVDSVGMRGLAGWFIVDAPDALPAVRETTDGALAKLREQIDRYPFHGVPGEAPPRVRSAVLLSGMGTDTEALVIAARRLADERRVPLVMHQSWSSSEVEASLSAHGVRPVERLHDLGILGPTTTLAHAIQLDDREVALLAQTGTSVVHCPPASVLRGVGAFRAGRFPELFAAGATVALGSDGGRGSKHDLARAMYLAATVHREVRAEVPVFTPEQVLEMATLHGARAVGMAGEIGSIEVGKRADLVIHALDRTESHPRLVDPVNALVYVMQSATVDTVYVDGEAIYDRGRFTRLDQGAVFVAVDRLAWEFQRRVGPGRFATWPVIGGPDA